MLLDKSEGNWFSMFVIRLRKHKHMGWKFQGTLKSLSFHKSCLSGFQDLDSKINFTNFKQKFYLRIFIMSTNNCQKLSPLPPQWHMPIIGNPPYPYFVDDGRPNCEIFMGILQQNFVPTNICYNKILLPCEMCMYLTPHNHHYQNNSRHVQWMLSV